MRAALGARRSAFALLLAGLVAPGALAAQTGVVRGRVVDATAGSAVGGAGVVIVGTRLGGVADSAGRFVIGGVPAGAREVRGRMIGYAPASARATVVAGDTVDVVLRLRPVAVTLGAVRAEARALERERFELETAVGSVAMTASARAAVPAIGERDLLRTVQLLPGVNARNDFSAGFNVRGGEADQNLVLLDGHPIYNPFHLGGLFGTFIDEAVSEVELLTAAFPAAYGGRLSSVLRVQPSYESRRGLHGTVGVSLLASHATIGSAFPGGRGGWQLAARRTYADKLASALSDRTLPYHFRDAQLHARHPLPWGGEVSLTAYDGRDLLDGDFAGISDTTAPGGGTFVFDWGNRVGGVTLAWPVARAFRVLPGLAGDSARVEQRVGLSHFGTTLDLGAGALMFRNRVDEWRASGEARWFAGTTRRGIGYEVSAHRVEYDVSSPETASLLYALSQRPTAVGAWIDERRRLTPRLLGQWGLRVESVSGASWTGVSPRASLKWFATPDLAVTAAASRHAQWMHSLAREDVPVRVFDFWVASDAWTRVSRATHGVLGVERWLGATRFVRVEGWVKRYDDLLEGNPADDPAVRGDEFVPADGTSHGADLLLRQIESGGVGGWVSYSYAVAARESLGRRYWPGHDRRHNLNVVASWRATPRWTLAGRFGWATGTPYTDIEGQLVRRIYDTYRNRWDTGAPIRQVEPVGGARNARRLPGFQRLDLSATGDFRWGPRRLAPYVSVVNAYNARNVFTYTFDYLGNPPTRQSISQFPLLPSIGLTVAF